MLTQNDNNATEESLSSSGIVGLDDGFYAATFSDYECLPNNGFNLMYKAKCYGKWFVLKGLKPEYASQAVYRRLLDKEFDLMVQLTHPHIVSVVARMRDAVVGECIVMEYIDGVTLAEFLRTKPSATVRWRIMGELLDALTYVHAKQIVHRDLKPSNILITHNGAHVKLIDFGLSDSDSHAILKQPAGSREYAAPEQLVGNAKIDCRADVYAVGKLLGLLFPHRYRCVARRCTRAKREQRYDNIELLQKALVRWRRLPRVLMMVATAMALAAVVAVSLYERHVAQSLPDVVSVVDTVVMVQRDTVVVEKQVQGYTSAEQAIIDKAYRDISAMLQPAFQAIDKGEIVYYEIANAQLFSFYKNVQKYTNQVAQTLDKHSLFYHEWFNATVVIQAEILNQYTSKIEALPRAFELREQGKLSEAEFQAVFDLARSLQTSDQ